MNNEIFQHVLEQWNIELVKNNRYILIITDNFSGHNVV